MLTASIHASSFIQLSESLQWMYFNWSIANRGTIFFPCVEYTNGMGISQRKSFYTDATGYNTIIEIPSDLTSFHICLPVPEFGNDLIFEFTQAKSCFTLNPTTYNQLLGRLGSETLSQFFHPAPEIFLADGETYSIDYCIFFYKENHQQKQYPQCILKSEINTLVSIINLN